VVTDGLPRAVPLRTWAPGWLRVQTHRDEILAIAGRHRALSVSVFGSVALGDDGPDSDTDFLVEFEAGASLLDLMRIQDDLEDLLGGHIDVVSTGGLKDRDEHIRREALLV
jgi:predicted nucleotidyltransferase